jgi:PAS domain-containing protein
MRDPDNKRRDSPSYAVSTLGAMLRASDGILDLLPIATFICDAHGAILQYNDEAVRIWGLTPQ